MQETQGNTQFATQGDAESDARDDLGLEPAAGRRERPADGHVEPPPIVGTAPHRLRPNAVPFDAIVVRSEFNAPAGSFGDREPVATPSASPRPAIDAAQEEVDLRLWLSLPEDVRRDSLERIESAVTAHPAPEAGRIIAAWRTLPEGLKAEWREVLSKAAGGLTDASKAPRAMTAAAPAG